MTEQDLRERIASWLRDYKGGLEQRNSKLAFWLPDADNFLDSFPELKKLLALLALADGDVSRLTVLDTDQLLPPLYERLPVDETTPVQFVGCYVTRWNKDEQPSVAFREADMKDFRRVQVGDAPTS